MKSDYPIENHCLLQQPADHSSLQEHVRMYDDDGRFTFLPFATSVLRSAKCVSMGSPRRHRPTPDQNINSHTAFRPLLLSRRYPGFWGDSCLNIFFMMHFSLFRAPSWRLPLLQTYTTYYSGVPLHYTRNC